MKYVLYLLVMIWIFIGVMPAMAQADIVTENKVTIGVYGDLEKAIKEIMKSDSFNFRFPKLEIEFQSSDYTGHHDRLVAQIAAGTGFNDIEAFSRNYVAEFANSNGFTDLSQFVMPVKNYKPNCSLCELTYKREAKRAFEFAKDIVNYSAAYGMTVNKKLIAFPLTIEPAVFFYRKSAADNSGVKLDGIQTWDEYIKKAKQLTIDKNGDGKIDQYALPNAKDFAAIPLSGSWFKGNEPLEPMDRFKTVLKLCKAVRDAGIDAQLPTWSAEWVASFKDGTAVTMFAGPWFGAHVQNWIAPDTAGDWRLDFPPGKTCASYGGAFLGIPEQVRKEIKPEAWEVIKYLGTDPGAQLTIFKMTDSFPVLSSVYNDPVMSEPVAFYGDQKVRLIFKEIAQKIPAQNVSQFDGVAEEIFNQAIDAVICDGISIEEAYLMAKKDIKNAMAE